MFDKQREAFDRPDKFIAVHTGRRGGKTEGFLFRALREMQRHPGCRIPYIALTRASAENILWRRIEIANERLGLGLVPKVSKLTWADPATGSEMFLVGANKSDELEKLRGQAFPLAGVDEASSFRATLLEVLIDDVLTYCMQDYDGTIVLVGTPGAACVGYFYDVCTGAQEGWSVHCWDSRHNPFMQPPHSPISAVQWQENLRKRRGWDVDDPGFLREAYGQWARDEDSLVYKWRPDRNGLEGMPRGYSPDSPEWSHVIGIDYGYVDSCAWVVLAFRRRRSSGDKAVYTVESRKQTGLLPDEAAAYTKTLVDRYMPIKIVGDAGGLGKPYIEEARRRWRLPIHNADKAHKWALIELQNDALRRGLLQVILETNRDLIGEAEILQWDFERVAVNAGGLVRHEQRRTIDERFEDHLCDAWRYAYGACHAYINEAPAKQPPPDLSRDAVDDEADAQPSKLRRRDEAGWLEARRKQQRRADWWK